MAGPKIEAFENERDYVEEKEAIEVDAFCQHCWKSRTLLKHMILSSLNEVLAWELTRKMNDQKFPKKHNHIKFGKLQIKNNHPWKNYWLQNWAKIILFYQFKMD